MCYVYHEFSSSGPKPYRYYVLSSVHERALKERIAEECTKETPLSLQMVEAQVFQMNVGYLFHCPEANQSYPL